MIKFVVISLTLLLHLTFLQGQQDNLDNDFMKALWKTISSTPRKVQENAASGLIKRLVPDRANEFQIEINQSMLAPDYKDKFMIESIDNFRIKITGTSGVAAANGLHYYLKYLANCHVSWSGDQLNLPFPLPTVKTPIKQTIQDKFRYYQNVCTSSYSMVWWNWKRWEREIDWMALNSINFPLAFVGQEAIWRKVFEDFGLNKQEVDQFFTGPAFLAWNRMGNVQGWAGVLTENWHLIQKQLQKKILNRMRSFGMLPILPAFSGHVPKNFTRVFPNAKVSQLGDWGGFNSTYCCTSFLDPNDPLFTKIGSTFIREYVQEFGTDHFYNTDLFNEMTPATKDLKYLASCGKAVYESIKEIDEQATWVMQGWLFYNSRSFWQNPQSKALLTSVPKGKMIVLDLFSELHPVFPILDSYYGQPWIWCMLQDFGGTLGLYGAANRINEGVFAARANYSNMLGIGLTPEGIEQNDVIYDFMMETTWHTKSIDLAKWFSYYSVRRYGVANKQIAAAWDLLRRSVYTDTMDFENHGQYIYVLRPKLNGQSPLWYDPQDVFSAWSLFVNASVDSRLATVETFRYDLVDITRQSLQLIFDKTYSELIQSYKANDQIIFNFKSAFLLDILDDLDDILSTNKHFQLRKWIESAISLAETDEEKRFNEFNAKNQLTLWGPVGNILDYAAKQWSGLVADYYKPRWKLFVEFLQKSLSSGQPFNQDNFDDAVFNQVELPFANSNGNGLSQPLRENTVVLATELYIKYQNYIQDYQLKKFVARWKPKWKTN